MCFGLKMRQQKMFVIISGNLCGQEARKGNSGAKNYRKIN
jgi:hypothetical protein